MKISIIKWMYDIIPLMRKSVFSKKVKQYYAENRDAINDYLDHLNRLSLIAIAIFLPLSISITNIGLIICLVIWLIKKIEIKSFKLTHTQLNIPLFIFLITGLISLFNTNALPQSLNGLRKVIKYILFYFIIIDSIKDRVFWRRLILIFILVSIVESFDGIFQYITGKDLIRGYHLGYFKNLKRVSATFHNANDFSIYIVTALPLISSLFLYRYQGFKKFISGFFSMLVLVSSILTFGRTTLLGLYGAALSFIMIKKDKIFLVFLLIFTLILPFTLPKSISNWLNTRPNIYSFFEDESRIDIWKVAKRIIDEHPVIGRGIGTFMYNYSIYRLPSELSEPVQAHNSFIQILAEMGILGLASFLLILYFLFRTGLSIYKRLNHGIDKALYLGLIGGIVAFLFSNFLDSGLYCSKLVAMFWFFVGLIMSYDILSKQDTKAIK